MRVEKGKQKLYNDLMVLRPLVGVVHISITESTAFKENPCAICEHCNVMEFRSTTPKSRFNLFQKGGKLYVICIRALSRAC